MLTSPSPDSNCAAVTHPGLSAAGAPQSHATFPVIDFPDHWSKLNAITASDPLVWNAATLYSTTDPAMPPSTNPKPRPIPPLMSRLSSVTLYRKMLASGPAPWNAPTGHRSDRFPVISPPVRCCTACEHVIATMLSLKALGPLLSCRYAKWQNGSALFSAILYPTLPSTTSESVFPMNRPCEWPAPASTMLLIPLRRIRRFVVRSGLLISCHTIPLGQPSIRLPSIRMFEAGAKPVIAEYVLPS